MVPVLLLLIETICRIINVDHIRTDIVTYCLSILTRGDSFISVTLDTELKLGGSCVDHAIDNVAEISI